MANLAQFDLKPRREETQIRTLLEDLTEYHMGVYPHNHLALAVWFAKSAGSHELHMLELFKGLPKEGFADSRFSLFWKTGSESPPFVNLRATSVDYFSTLLRTDPTDVALYKNNYEVLYFDKKLLTLEILDTFRVITEPPGLMKGWYVEAEEYEGSKSVEDLLSRHQGSKPYLGLVKTEESPDFENCRGITHVEISQKWLPSSPEGIRAYTYYTDQQRGRPVYLLFEGGSLYQVLKFEVKTAPEYSGRLLEKTRDDRYPEVYLRAVRPPAQSKS